MVRTVVNRVQMGAVARQFGGKAGMEGVNGRGREVASGNAGLEICRGKDYLIGRQKIRHRTAENWGAAFLRLTEFLRLCG